MNYKNSDFLNNEYLYYFTPFLAGLFAWFFSGMWSLGVTILVAGLLGNWYYIKSHKKKSK